MSKLLFTRLALMFLVIAMMSNSLWEFGASSITHDLNHLSKASLAVHDEYPGIDVSASNIEQRDDVASPLVHHMLHACDHFQLFPHAVARTVFAPSERIFVLPGLMAIHLPLPTLAPPFRPPRPDVLSA